MAIRTVSDVAQLAAGNVTTLNATPNNILCQLIHFVEKTCTSTDGATKKTIVTEAIKLVYDNLTGTQQQEFMVILNDADKLIDLIVEVCNSKVLKAFKKKCIKC